MLFKEALEFTHKFRECVQSRDTFLVVSVPGSIYYSGYQIYVDQNVRVCKLDNSNGQSIDYHALKSLLHSRVYDLTFY